MLIDIAQTVITTHVTWYYSVQNWADPTVFFRDSPWSAATIPLFAGLVSGIVQLFYSWRIWVLAPTKVMRGLAILISLIAVSQGATAIVTSIVIQFDKTQQRLLELHPAFEYWLAGSFTVDILISAAMLYILYTAKSRTPWSRTDNLFNRLIINAIQTGSITVICAGVDLALFVAFTSNNYHYVPAYILAKLYSNSLLATLNGRKSLNNGSTGGSIQTESVGMRLQVSRVTERTTDATIVRGPWGGDGKVDYSNDIDVESGHRSHKAEAL
ncbi:hypothetical protein CPC08DRAFT_692169 [Agrocybe pediades]|nr:hypothetical protein CPC08DRAFT_692169 [Agrocybe pediades]